MILTFLIVVLWFHRWPRMMRAPSVFEKNMHCVVNGKLESSEKNNMYLESDLFYRPRSLYKSVIKSRQYTKTCRLA